MTANTTAQSAEQRVAIVTGGGRGIGASIAQRLSNDGLTVAVLDLDLPAARGVADAINATGGRAAAGPFGGTIAHGYLSLSMIPQLLDGMLEVTEVAHALNYGAEGVRFLAPVKVNGRLRLTATIADVSPVASGHKVTMQATIEIEGSTRPACFAQVVYLYTA